jgi:hypothetical protein
MSQDDYLIQEHGVLLTACDSGFHDPRTVSGQRIGVTVFDVLDLAKAFTEDRSDTLLSITLAAPTKQDDQSS